MNDIITEWLRHFGGLSFVSGATLALIFAAANFVPFPRTFLCLGAGTVFGLMAVPIILPSTTLGGVLSFLLARYVLADRLQRQVDKQPQLRAIADAIDSESWRAVALLRLASPVPTTVQNYLFGTTRIRLWPYTVATFVFTIPQVFLYVYIGAVGRAALLEKSSSTLNLTLMVIGATCLIVASSLIWRKARTALHLMPRKS
jgi:uncharacterized membrane protein YdjX (TVP38/TMEM64 family)